MELIIVGAGGLGREIYSWLMDDFKNSADVSVKGFLDDDPEALGDRSYPIPILGKIENYHPAANEKLVVAVGDPTTRYHVVEILRNRGALFYTFIHSTVLLGTNVLIGSGSVVCPYCIFTNDITIGEFVFVNVTSNIGHDTQIGNYTTINSKVEITGGNRVGEECFFGVGSKVIPGREIGSRAKIGAGSVVVQNVSAGMSLFGNPAKPIGAFSQTEAIDKISNREKSPETNGHDTSQEVEALEEKMVIWLKKISNEAYGEEISGVGVDTDLIQDAIVDSIGFIELIEFIEKDAGVKIDLTEAEAGDLTTISGLCSYVRKIQGKG